MAHETPMIDMKKTKTKKSTRIQPAIMDEELYPYGLEIGLSKESMAKLGKSADHIAVGGKIRIYAEALVMSIDASESMRSEGGGISSRLQIQKMSIMAPEASTKSGSAQKGTLSEIKQRLRKN